MFNKGTPNGDKGLILIGGQISPISIEGANLLCTKAQKKEKKSIHSDTINNIIPHFKPLILIIVCIPCIVLSRTTSRHHCNIVSMIIHTPHVIKTILL